MTESEVELNDDADRSEMRNGKFRRVIIRIIAIRGILPTLAGSLAITVVGGIIVAAIETGMIKPFFESVGAMAPIMRTPVAPVPQTSAKPVPDAVDTSRRCRSPKVADAPVDIAPCIVRAGNILEISTDVVSREPTEVTVHVWLYDNVAKYRPEYTLNVCRLTFTAAGQFQRCGPFLVRPDRPGHYLAATAAQEGAVDLPPSWRDSTKTGILSGGGAVSWPLR